MDVELQRPWVHVVADLNKALAECRLSPDILGKKAGISYHSARRFLKNGVKKRSVGALKLCNAFAVSLRKKQKVQTELFLELANVLRDTWDGSEAHAELIASLIKSTKPFRIEGRG